MGQLTVLRAIGLAGVAELANVARAAGLDVKDARARVAEAEEAELVVETPRGYRLTGAGRDQVAAGLRAERASLDPATTAELYDRFGRIDRRFKELVTEYQLSEEPTRLSWAVARMSEVHPKVHELALRAADVVPRLMPYSARFDDAMAHLERGNEKYLASVTLDSYHTVWFQFHEELIEMAGRTRAEEAAEGRG